MVALLGAFLASASAQEEMDLIARYKQQIRANQRNSLPHFRLAEIYFQQRQFQDAGNEFREALNGDLQPRWLEVWAHVNLGKLFDFIGQRERAINEYRQALRTKDNTRGALDEAELYLSIPYPRSQ
jgi:tetratricopeptide (TPR) repeat protein